jgi:hypothetical protein
MIRVEVTPAGAGQFEWVIRDTHFWSVQQPVYGRSREPLLDACRRLKSMGAEPQVEIGLFHGQATDDWTLRTTVGQGSGLTVRDQASGGRPKFTAYRPHPGGRD